MTRALLCILAALALTTTGCVTTGTTPTGEAGAASAGKAGPASLAAMLDQEEKALTQQFADAGEVSVQRLDDAMAVIFLSDSFFDVDSSELKPDSPKDLEHLADLLKRFQGARVEISCYTDSSGSEQHNLNLSLQRAQAVAALLTRSGIDPSRMEFRGYGETNFVASNATEHGRKMNRRIIFVIMPIGVQSLPNPPARENSPSTLSMRTREGNVVDSTSVLFS